MLEDKSINLIEKIDRELFELNNELSALNYKLDCGKESAAEDVDLIEEKIRNLLMDQSLNDAVDSCLNSTSLQKDSLIQRKAVLLKRKIRFLTIENEYSLRESRWKARQEINNIDLDKWMGTLSKNPDRSERCKALEGLSKGCRNAEAACRELAKNANYIAQQAGYQDYTRAKLEYDGLTEETLYSYFKFWYNERISEWDKILDKYRENFGGEVKAYDIEYILNQCQSHIQKYFSKEKKLTTLDKLLNIYGTSIKELPISVEQIKLPFIGSCYRITPGKDIRILLDSDNSGINSYYVLLHEFGHAIYYCHCPVDSELLIDGHLSREIMADIWTHFIKDKDFLIKIMDLSQDIANEIIETRRCYETIILLLIIRDSMFILEVLKNPDIPFSEIWRAVSNKWLGIDDDSGAYETFDFRHMLDLKGYAFAQILSKRTFTSLTESGFNVLEKPGFFDSLVNKLYKPGNMIDWQTKFGL
ncbi:hypothetical protein KKB18_10440 [bacterium]|nr:hypothetical protein [bacterium]